MIYVIGGPTGSGKTALAIDLAQRWHAPIINADAFQRYQGLDIGTNKEKAILAPFHPYLFDDLKPDQPTSVADYQQAARQLIDRLQTQHQKIVMVGGTGLYIKATLYDFSFLNKSQPHDHLETFSAFNNEALHQYLAKIDYPTSQKIHPNNRRRILRAIAIFQETGQPKSVIEAQQKKHLLYPTTFIGLAPSKTELIKTISNRVQRMFAQGWIEEVQALKRLYSPEIQAFQAIGYREVMAYLDGKMTQTAMMEAITLATTRYAKRQLTYFRHQFPMQWYASLQEAKDTLTR